MWTVIELGWWATAASAAWQVGRKHGLGSGVATVMCLWMLSALVEPSVGTVATAALAMGLAWRAAPPTALTATEAPAARV